MKTKFTFLFFAAFILFIGQACRPTATRDELDLKVENLLSQMTIEEKVGQMTQVTLDVITATDSEGRFIVPHRVDPEKLRSAVVDHHVGSIFNVAGYAFPQAYWHELLGAIHEMTQETDKKIPVLYGIDAVHGHNYATEATMFPQQIGMAATWNLALVEKAASITAYETRATGIAWNFAPVLDLGRHPAWPRFWETFGEDVFLASQMGKASVRGLEGDDIGSKYNVAATMKHYIGYSVPVSGKDRTPALIPDITLRELHLPVFAAAIEAGAHSIMINSAEVNGVPVHASHYLLTEILRNELGFEGLAVSDWLDVKRLYTRHRVAKSPKEAVKMAVMVGVDMSMVPHDFSFYNYLVELVREGAVPMWRIDQAVGRILKLKFQLGLFENFLYPISDYPYYASEKHQLVSLEAARESITLLKNQDNVLPIPRNARVLVTGFAANSMATLNGGWTYTWMGLETDRFADHKMTILEAITEKAGKNNVMWAQGATFNELTDVKRAVQLAATADYIVLCLGEMPYAETPGNIGDLHLPEAQATLALSLAATGKPVILVLTQGRPRIISKFADQMDAIIMAYLPGNEGGIAIADILYGDVNPSGKLPFTYPREPNALITYDHNYSELDPETISVPQFNFGHGLSYTTFNYANLKLSATEISANQSIQISIEVSNTGYRQGKEVVQLYISDLFASITPPVRRLRGFEKIDLEPGETKTVIFEIRPSDLAFVNADLKWVTEPGEFMVQIGGETASFVLL
ncbi:MAG TPA: glycoside hydrolase family 3 N-terminal domain-containing protein [Bacteroidales bacterium]|nr:glycoside hydrolase family 3 N-terminal domain-containing protein [Bacteroidales bacterium]